MNNPFFNAFGGGNNIMNMLQQLKANPAQMLSKRFNLPAQISDPNALLQHLVNSGQVTQQQIDAAYRQAQQLGFKR